MTLALRVIISLLVLLGVLGGIRLGRLLERRKHLKTPEHLGAGR